MSYDNIGKEDFDKLVSAIKDLARRISKLENFDYDGDGKEQYISTTNNNEGVRFK